MPIESLRLSVRLSASPDELYALWLNDAGHSSITDGAPASIDAREGGRYTAWGGYIEGVTLTLVPGRQIVQSWRTSDFKPDDAPSRLTLTFEPDGSGTHLLLAHDELPEGTGEQYRAGWEDYYFVYMRALLGTPD